MLAYAELPRKRASDRFDSQKIKIEAVMTDNGSAHVSLLWCERGRALDPRRPRTLP